MVCCFHFRCAGLLQGADLEDLDCPGLFNAEWVKVNRSGCRNSEQFLLFPLIRS